MQFTVKMDSIETTLEQKGIKITPNRILVARFLDRSPNPVSMTDIEYAIDTLDKSSVFRVLTHFVDKDFVHVIDDGSGSLKYELCRGNAGHSMDDMHIHFKCEGCGRVFCFESEQIPGINLPEGFSLFAANFVGKGLCPDCGGKP